MLLSFDYSVLPNSLCPCPLSLLMRWTLFLWGLWWQITETMVKAVAVLAGTDVKGTIFFSQEGDGNSRHMFWLLMRMSWLMIRTPVHIDWLVANDSIWFMLRSDHRDWKYLWPQAGAPWVPCARAWWHHQRLHVDWYLLHLFPMLCVYDQGKWIVSAYGGNCFVL